MITAIVFILLLFILIPILLWSRVRSADLIDLNQSVRITGLITTTVLILFIWIASLPYWADFHSGVIFYVIAIIPGLIMVPAALINVMCIGRLFAKRQFHWRSFIFGLISLFVLGYTLFAGFYYFYALYFK